MENYVDPVETAHYKLFHLDLHCLQRYMYWSTGMKGLKWQHKSELYLIQITLNLLNFNAGRWHSKMQFLVYNPLLKGRVQWEEMYLCPWTCLKDYCIIGDDKLHFSPKSISSSFISTMLCVVIGIASFFSQKYQYFSFFSTKAYFMHTHW